MEKCMRPERAGIADVFYDVAMAPGAGLSAQFLDDRQLKLI